MWINFANIRQVLGNQCESLVDMCEFFHNFSDKS